MRSVFLVGAFLGKSARLLQWLVFFFFCSSDHRPHVPLFTDFTLAHMYSSVVNPAVTGSSPCFSQKLFRASFFGTVRHFQFFRHCAIFFRKFFLSSKGSPSSFLIFCSKLVSKSPKSRPFLVFRHYETVSKISFFVFFSKNLPKKLYIF